MSWSLFGRRAQVAKQRLPKAQPARNRRVRLNLESLEDRVVPAFDLAMSAAATANVSVNTVANVTTYTATGTGANVSSADVLAQLNLGNDVVINTGSTGVEAGNITVVNGVVYAGVSARALTFVSGTGAGVTGDVIINDAISGAGTSLSVEARALRHVQVNANINAGSGSVMIYADVDAAANADNGLGSVTVAAAATVSTTGQVTLHGADIDLDGNVNLASRLTLNATIAGAVQTSGSITVNELLITGLGNFSLNQSTNDSVTLAADISGSLTYQDLNDLSIGTVAGVNGITAGGHVTLNVGASVGINSAIDVGLGNVAINIGLQTGAAVSATFGVGSSIVAGSASITGRVGASDTIRGADIDNVFVVNGPGSGTLSNASLSIALTFSEIEHLEGGIAGDVFFIASTAALIASIDGRLGLDVLKFGRIQDIDLNIGGAGTVDGFAGAAAGVTAFNNINARGNIAFGVSANTNQLFRRLFDLAGNPIGGWVLGGPVRFTKVVVGAWGADRAGLVFGLGVDGRIYAARFTNLGVRVSAWTAVSAQVFADIAVGTYGTAGASVVFGIGRNDRQIYAAKFNVKGNLARGFTLVGNGRFQAIAVGQVGVNGQEPILFGIAQFGNRAFYARFNANADVRIGYRPTTLHGFRKLAVAVRQDGSVLLFGLHMNQRVSLARFAVDGSLAANFSVIGSATFRSISTAPLGSGNLGGVVHADVDTIARNRAVFAAGFNGAGVQTSAFTQLNQGLFQNTGADADASVLYGTDVSLLDNPLDNLLSGFFNLGGSAFTSVALS